MCHQPPRPPHRIPFAAAPLQLRPPRRPRAASPRGCPGLRQTGPARRSHCGEEWASSSDPSPRHSARGSPGMHELGSVSGPLAAMRRGDQPVTPRRNAARRERNHRLHSHARSSSVWDGAERRLVFLGSHAAFASRIAAMSTDNAALTAARASRSTHRTNRSPHSGERFRVRFLTPSSTAWSGVNASIVRHLK